MIKRLSQQFNYLIQKFPHNQLSQEWFELRKKSITATDVSAILLQNPWNYPFNIFLNKYNSNNVDNVDNIVNNNADGNDATKWGNKYEPIAKNIFQNILNTEIFNLGFVQHPVHKWLGASPDGILKDGTLIEFKCPFKNQNILCTPPHYWIQTQIQLEVCNLDKCLLIKSIFEEQKPHNYMLEGTNGEWYLKDYHIETIYRDKNWFDSIFPKLLNFHNIISNASEFSNISQEELMEKINNILKSKCTRSYYSRINELENYNIFMNWKQFNSTNKIKNYILDDKLIDCLHNENKMDENISFVQNFYEINTNFKKQIFNFIQNKFKNHFVNILRPYEQISLLKYFETKEALHNNIPIIINPLLINMEKRLYGYPDMIIKGFILKKLIENIEIEIVDDMYYIVSIRYINLKINLNCSISNSGNKKYRKALNIIHNKLLNDELKTINPISFMIGRNYIYKESTITNPFNRVGIIKEDGVDIELKTKTYEAYDWINKFETNEQKDEYLKDNYYQIGFNMKNKNDHPWHNLKNEIANDKKDVTKIWRIGNRLRQKLYDRGITKWNDLKIVREIKNKKQKNLIRKIIKVNKKYQGNVLRIKKRDKRRVRREMGCDDRVLSVYVDFEYCSSSFIDELPEDMNYTGENIIYLIGIGYNKPETGEWIFNEFHLSDFGNPNNIEMINKMQTYILELLKTYPEYKSVNLYHWNHVERNIYDKYADEVDEINWCDLLKVVKDNKIVLNGMFNFGLKSYASVLYKRGLIKTKWEGDINGLSSIDLIRKITKETNYQNIEGHKLWKDIVKYNEVDCKVLMEIRNFLMIKTKK
jgi:putative phage-type endonuclease